jgi:hydroxypyruvate isomerase
VKVSLCVESVFTDRPFIEGVAAAADLGIPAVEFWSWGDKDLEGLKQVMDARQIAVATFSGNAGGSLIERRHRERVLEGFEKSMRTARELGCSQVMCLTDEINPDLSVKSVGREISQAEKGESLRSVLRELARLGESYEVTVLLEPCNSKVDLVGFFLDKFSDGLELVREIGSDRLKLLCDVYHLQIMEGNLIQTIRENIDDIAHFHIADVPGWHQPGTGEINYRNVLKAIAETGYDGYIGLEMFPVGDPVEATIETLELFPS